MSEQVHELKFSGYWREPNAGGIPAESGIYGAHVCTFNEEEKSVSLQQLLYIGESDNAKASVANHLLWPTWRQYLSNDEQLCFNFAPVGQDVCRRIAAALIFHHKPPCNDEFSDDFPFPPTAISTSGRHHLLAASVHVAR
jgi:hypothetical protein